MVLESLPFLITQYPTLKYLLAGQADLQEQNRLEKLVMTLNIADYVSFIGFIPDEELSNYFRLADIFIMPSRKEGFGIVFIEAAACGCKIIGGDQDGTPQALLNGKLGTLINPESKETLITAIEEQLMQPRLEQSSRRLQEVCIDNFNYNQYNNQIHQILQQL
jgi:glycosyltransferase involved in cell wall biosynthesis